MCVTPLTVLRKCNCPWYYAKLSRRVWVAREVCYCAATVDLRTGVLFTWVEDCVTSAWLDSEFVYAAGIAGGMSECGLA